MRTVTIEYGDEGFHIIDNLMQWVIVNIEDETAFFISQFEDDDAPVAGSCHKDDAMAQALNMMGVLV